MWRFNKQLMKAVLWCAAILPAALLPVQWASAHAIWFAQRAGKTALIYGEGAEDLDAVQRRDKLRELLAYNAAGQPVVADWIQTDHLLWVDEATQPALFSVSMDNGLWTKTTEGKWLAQGRQGLADYRSSGRYLKYAVRWNAPVATWPALPAQRLQIRPLQQALPVEKGQRLTVQVLFDGQPLNNAPVLADVVNDPDGKPLRTDRQGRVTLRVRNQGLNVLAVHWQAAAPAGEGVDFTEHVATLSFVLPHAEE